MPATVSHALSMTTPDNPAYENQPKHWNSGHLFTLNASGSEISGAFGNGGGVTFGLSADGKVTASAPAAAPSPVNFSAGTTSNNLGSVVFTNANGVSFQLNGSTISASIATTYAGTGFTSTTTAGTEVKATNNTAGLSMAVPAFITTFAAQTNQSAIRAFGASNTGNTAGNTGVSTGIDWVIAGTNNITVSQSTAVGGPNTIWLSAPSPGAGGNVNFSAGTTSSDLSAVTFSNSNNMTFGLGTGASAGVITGSFNAINVGVSTGGATAGTTGTVEGAGGQYLFVGTNGITLSQSTNGANSGTVTIVGNAITISEWPPFPGFSAGAQSRNSGTTGATGGSTQITASMTVIPQVFPYALSFNRINIRASAQTVAGTGNATVGYWVGIYTLSNSTKLNLLSSLQFNLVLSQNSVTARSHSMWWGGNSTSNSTGTNGNISASFTGEREALLFTGGTSLSPGQYYFAFGHTCATAVANLNSSNSFVGAAYQNAVNLIGQNTGATGAWQWNGVFSTTTNTNSTGFGVFPATIDRTAMSTSNVASLHPLIFMRSA